MSNYKEILKVKQQNMKLAAEEFSKGADIKDVMKKYNVSYASIYNAIKRYKIDYEYTFGRTIFFNQNYFDNITEEHQAYWLGFIYADGTIVRTDENVSAHNRLQIGLSIKDEEHLKLFAKYINYPIDKLIYYTPPNSYTSSSMCYIQCNSLKITSDLIKVGCIPNKTTHSFMPKIPQNLIKHFIRGYFDGDGSISRNFSITSEGNILHQMQNILMKECDLNKTKIPFRKNSYTLSYGGRQQLTRIYHYLYDDSTVYLQRKYDKFHTIAFATDKTISSSVA